MYTKHKTTVDADGSILNRMHTRPHGAGRKRTGEGQIKSSIDMGVISGVRQLQEWSAHGDAPYDSSVCGCLSEYVRFRLRSTGVGEFTEIRKGQLKLQG